MRQKATGRRRKWNRDRNIPSWIRPIFCAVPGLEKFPRIQNPYSRKVPLTRHRKCLRGTGSNKKKKSRTVDRCQAATIPRGHLGHLAFRSLRFLPQTAPLRLEDLRTNSMLNHTRVRGLLIFETVGTSLELPITDLPI